MLYEYECRHCEHTLEVKQKMDDKPLKKCPSCKKHKLFLVVTGGAYQFIYGEPTTVQHQADRNTKKMGTHEYEARIKADKAAERDKQKAKRQALQESGMLPAGANLPDEVNHRSWYGKIDESKRKEIANANNDKEKGEKMKKYIMEGK